MRALGAWVVIAASIATGGCSAPANLGFAIAITVDADASISDAALATVQALRYHVTGDETYDRSETLGREMGRVERVVYRPGTASRTVQLTLTASDGNGGAVGRGQSPVVELVPDKTSVVVVVLSASSGSQDGGLADSMLIVDAAGTSCDDGEQNGDEAGIDCGGSCKLKCPGTICATADECVTASCDTVCVLASGPPSWLPEASMPAARMDHGCATTLDGKILIVGGNPNTSPAQGLLATLTHVPGSNDWPEGPKLINAHSRFAVTTDKNGSIYAIGGYDTSGTPSSNSEVLTTLGWNAITPLQIGHAGIAAATSPDGRLVVVDTGLNEIYSVSSNSWATFPVSGVARETSGVATAIDGLLYSFGGDDGSADRKTNEAWDPSTGIWATRASMSRPRGAVAGVAAPDGRLYAIGGVESIAVGGVLQSVEAYTPSTDRWTSVAMLQVARDRFGACVARDGRIFATGGYGQNGTVLNAVDVYGPVLTYAPGNPSAGQTLTLSLHNFASSARVRVTFDGGTAVLGMTDSLGDATLSFSLPANSAGDHHLGAVDVRSVYPFSTVLTVNP